MYRSSSSISLAPLGCPGLAQWGELAQGLPHRERWKWQPQLMKDSVILQGGCELCIVHGAKGWKSQLPPGSAALGGGVREPGMGHKGFPRHWANIWAAGQERSLCYQSRSVHRLRAEWPEASPEHPLEIPWLQHRRNFKGKQTSWRPELIQSSAAMHVWHAVQTKERKRKLSSQSCLLSLQPHSVWRTKEINPQLDFFSFTFSVFLPKAAFTCWQDLVDILIAKE